MITGFHWLLMRYPVFKIAISQKKTFLAFSPMALAIGSTRKRQLISQNPLHFCYRLRSVYNQVTGVGELSNIGLDGVVSHSHEFTVRDSETHSANVSLIPFFQTYVQEYSNSCFGRPPDLR